MCLQLQLVIWLQIIKVFSRVKIKINLLKKKEVVKKIRRKKIERKVKLVQKVATLT